MSPRLIDQNQKERDVFRVFRISSICNVICVHVQIRVFTITIIHKYTYYHMHNRLAHSASEVVTQTFSNKKL